MINHPFQREMRALMGHENTPRSLRLRYSLFMAFRGYHQSSGASFRGLNGQLNRLAKDRRRFANPDSSGY